MSIKVKKIRVKFPSQDPESIDGDLLFNSQAQAWAKGTNDNQEIPAPLDPLNQDYLKYPHIENNAKYYSEQAANSATAAANSATFAASSVLTGNLAPLFSQEITYSEGQYVLYDDGEKTLLYKFMQSHTGAWDIADVEAATAVQIMFDSEKFKNIIANIFDPTKNYVTGERVIYNNKLYRANTVVIANSGWQSEDWSEEINIADELFFVEKTMDKVESVNTLDWEIGSIRATDNTDLNNTKRARSTNYIIPQDAVIQLKVKTGYQFLIFAYDATNTYIGCYNGVNFSKNVNTVVWIDNFYISKKIYPYYKFRCVLKKEDQASASAIENTSAAISAFASNLLFVTSTTKKLYDKLQTINNNLDALNNNFIMESPIYVNVSPYEDLSNSYINNTGTIVSHQNSGYHVYRIKCKPGDKFKINARVYYYQTYFYSWVHVQPGEEPTFISGQLSTSTGPNGETTVDKEFIDIVAPDGANQLWQAIALYEGYNRITQKLSDDPLVYSTDKSLTLDKAANAKIVGTKLEDVKTAIEDTTGNIIIPVTQTGKYVKFIAGENGAVDTADIENLVSANTMECVIVACSAGDVFTISTRGGTTGRAYMFLGSVVSETNRTVLEVSPSSKTYQRWKVTAPAGTEYLVVNAYQTHLHVYRGELLVNQVARDADVINESFTSVIASITGTVTSKKYINNEGVIDDTNNTNNRIMEIVPEENAEYLITGRAFAQNYYFAFYNANEQFMDGLQGTGTGMTTITDYRTVTPVGAAKLVVASSSSINFDIKGVTGYALTGYVKTSEFNELSAEVEAIEENYVGTYEAVTGTITANMRIVSDGTISPYNNSTYKVLEIDVTPGDKFILNAGAWAGTYYYAFYNSSDVFISGSGMKAPADLYSTYITRHKVTAPSGAAKLAVAMIKNDPIAKKLTSALKPSGANPWAGKKWALMGDSLTEVNAKADKRYYDWISDATGVECFNMGYGGSGYRRAANNSRAFYQRMANIPADYGIDFMTIFGSGNDCTIESGESWETVLGTYTDASTDTICGCVNATLDAFYAKYPTTPIGIIAPAPWQGYPTTTPGNRLEQYTEKLRQISEYRGVPFLDLYHGSNLRPENAANRTACFGDADGEHPNNLGHSIIAPKIYEFVKTLIMA